MLKLTDELLMAYADGELTPDQTAVVADALRRDPTARRRLALVEQANALLRDAYRGPAQEDTPDWLNRLLADGGGSSADVVDLKARVGRLSAYRASTSRLSRGGIAARAAALAAGVVLMVGLGAGYVFIEHGLNGPGASQWADAVTSDSPLYRALEHTPSLTQVAWGDGNVLPVQTFRDAAGRNCRQYQLVLGGRDGVRRASEGLACRSSAGQWRTIVQVTLPQEPVEGGAGYVPALGGDGTPLEAVLSEIGARPVSDGVEAELLRSNWGIN